MRLKKVTDNGNVALRRQDLVSLRNSENLDWNTSNTDSSNLYENRTGNRQLNYNCNNIYDSNETTEILENYTTGTETEIESRDKVNVDLVVCNKQYRINNKNIVNFVRTSTESTNLEEATKTDLASRESFLGDTDVQALSDSTPIDERAFELSDTDDMSENGIRPVPRGIVNPNYPGFHHLAHTLQDYSSNIENFYHSENEMTDDDVDIEITELVYEAEQNQNESSIEYKNINNNNVNDDKASPIQSSPQKTLFSNSKILDSCFKNEIPDLLKTISKNNNNIDSYNYDINCTDTDIENNFHTKDIIGDFNKEIEDEIKQLLNYNINIQDDLEELRKDIKDTLAKPIENTINNISDVVNHVIKKLVETHNEPNEDSLVSKKVPPNEKNDQENIDTNKENETNTRTEMNLSRPTFLFIDNNTNCKIKDAFLSDGKDEINVNYDPDKISQNVENTIKQLSTELRKIIPKLDEMRERDRLWAESNKESLIVTDGNSNEIASSSCYFSLISNNSIDKIDACKNMHNETHTMKNMPVQTQNESKVRDRQNEVNTSISNFPNAQSNTSVRKRDSPRDLDFGSFDVYNIETALPKLDLDAIENHLKAAKEAERQSFVTNIKRKLSKTSDEIHCSKETEKTGFKKTLHLFKLRLLKSDAVNTGNVPVVNCDDIALSPRATGTADCAQTEIEWPILTDNNPNILEKFTRIVNITDNVPYDRKKRNDREEIRKRLAMGADAEEYYSMGHTDRPGKKPSLHSRLQSGMNLQICFMNETASDNESQPSEMEKNLNYNKSLSRSNTFNKTNYNHPYQTRPLSVNITKHDKISTVQSGAKLRPSSLMLKPTKSRSAHSLGHIELRESDFYALQATLQTEARIALAQAKEMARIQMERERRCRAVSPVTEMLQRGMTKANAPLARDRRRVSRQLLTDMNIAQLQVVVNELHSQIESLNDSLVKFLMARDELHMGQDSMLVDIEDLTRYLGVKEQTKKTKGTAKSGMKRLTSLVHK